MLYDNQVVLCYKYTIKCKWKWQRH